MKRKTCRSIKNGRRCQRRSGHKKAHMHRDGCVVLGWFNRGKRKEGVA